MRWVLQVMMLALGAGCSGSAANSVAEGGNALKAMERSAGERYVLELVNRDRVEHGLSRVEWDPVAAAAARRHAEDMCEQGFTAHWGSDGSTPEARYTEAGGVDMVQENAAGVSDAERRELVPAPDFSRRDLEGIETAFIDEVPPQDGHRRNVLEARHNRLGVGLARGKGSAQPCLVQEFVDRYGAYIPVPTTVRLGQPVRIAGEIFDPARFAGVGVARVKATAPKGAAALNRSSIYRIPDPFVLYFPQGFRTPKPVEVTGPRFAIEVPVDENGAAGEYEISVWARFPGSDALAMVSNRTLRVNP